MKNFFRERKERKEREIAQQKRREEKQKLRNTPHKEMFKTLREEGGIVSIKELWETNRLTPEILSIWDQTIEEIFLLSLNPEKVRWLCDTKHLYFIPYKQYEGWDLRLKIFMNTLGGLNSLNSFSIVNDIGSLIYLNPLGEPIDHSHDEAIREIFEDFWKKAQL